MFFISMVSARFSRKLRFCKLPKSILFYNIREGCFFPHAAVETRTSSWYGHGCSGHRMLPNTNVIEVWAGMHWQPYALETQTLVWFGHGCTDNRMLSKHKRYHGLGNDALVTVCSPNTNVIMAGAWMHW